jgi:hypothetical protein
MNNKGQLSFDMIFAVMLVLIVLIMTVNYNNVIAESNQKTRSSVLLESLSSSLASRINNVYVQSRLLRTNLTMRINLPDEGMLGIDYTFTIGGGVSRLSVQEVGGFSRDAFTQPLLFAPCRQGISRREGGSLQVWCNISSCDCR